MPEKADNKGNDAAGWGSAPRVPFAPRPRPVERWTAKGTVTVATTMQITSPPAIGPDRHDGLGPRVGFGAAGTGTGLPDASAAGLKGRG